MVECTAGPIALGKWRRRAPLRSAAGSCAISAGGRSKSKSRTSMPSEKLPEVKPSARGKQRLPEIADLCDPGGNVLHREVLDTNAFLDLFPRDRRGNGRVGARTNRVNRGQCPPPGVLVVIDQHPAARPLRHFVLRGD